MTDEWALLRKLAARENIGFEPARLPTRKWQTLASGIRRSAGMAKATAHLATASVAARSRSRVYLPTMRLTFFFSPQIITPR